MSTLWQIAVSLHWFNPALRAIVRRQRFLTETRCDELSCRALGNGSAERIAYSKTLLDMAEETACAEGALCLSESQHNLSQRIERLLSPRARKSGWAVSTAAAALLAASVMLPLFTLKAQQLPAPTPNVVSNSTLLTPNFTLIQPQSPRLDVAVAAGERPMETRAMAVNARIRGLHAEVETTLTFHNPNARQLEGELVFPLPDGAVVSGYALDVNGTLVDGVVVKKEKARVAFETETRARVDPGIVEHVKGNVYRTRIYPLPPNASRTVKLRYVTELASDARGDVALSLALPRENIGRLDIRVDADTAAAAPEIGGFGNLRFARAGNAWIAETTLENTLPGADIFVALPKLPALVHALERDENGDTYFTLSDMPPPPAAASAKNQKFDALNIAWDASRSRADAPLSRELELLEKLAAESGAKKFNLILFRDRAYGLRKFETFADLKTALEREPFDGGTDLAALAAALKTHAADAARKDARPPKTQAPWLIFTDGMDTLGDALPELDAGIAAAAIVSQSTADREALRQLCRGALIDLQRLDTAAAAAQILQPPRRVAGIEGSGVAAVQGIGAAAGAGRVMLAGRLAAPAAELRVVYSDGARSAPVKLAQADASAGRLLATVWAAGRVTRLAVNAEQNEDELLDLGRRFSLVSPATSLIVLENLDQYLRHEIEPPEQLADMRRLWRERIVNSAKTSISQQNLKLNRVVSMWTQRVRWYEGHPEPKPVTKAAAPAPRTAALEPRLAFFDRVDDAPASPPPQSQQGQPASGASGTTDFRHPQTVRRANSAAGQRVMDAIDESFDADSPAPARVVQIAAWDPATPYLARLKAAPKTEREAVYLDAAKTFAASPAFFLDCADFLLSNGDAELGLRALSNLAEMRIEDAALLRVLAWRLQQAGDLDRAVTQLRRVTRLRPEDPQSWRDLALALAERGKRDLSAPDLERAQELLQKVIFGAWNRTPEIEIFALEELNALMDWIERADWTGKQKPAPAELDPRLRKNLDLDLRIVMSWDADATDIDLHVIEPSGEEAYYRHNRTSINGLVSRDITDGYGPEEYLLRRAPAGAYTVKANYYGSRRQTVLGPATLTARVYTQWGRADESCRLLTLRLDKQRDMIAIGKISVGAEAIALTKTADFSALRIGMTPDEVRAAIGAPDTGDNSAEWRYTRANRKWLLEFDNARLIRASELLPGDAKMIIAQ